MHKKLFIPGPTEVYPDILEKMATPMAMDGLYGR